MVCKVNAQYQCFRIYWALSPLLGKELYVSSISWFKAYNEDGGGVEGRGGEFLREIWKYFVGILKIHKLFLPNGDLILLALHLLEKKLSITSGKQS